MGTHVTERDFFWFRSVLAGMGNVFFDARGLISRVSAKKKWYFLVFFGVFIVLGGVCVVPFFCFFVFSHVSQVAIFLLITDILPDSS